MEKLVKKLVDLCWEEVKKETHKDDLPLKEKNYKKLIQGMPDFVIDIKSEIKGILRQ